MNWNSIKEKIRQEDLLKSIFKNPIMVVVAFIVMAISLVNFSTKDNEECGATLTYDEIYEAITLTYCKLDHAKYQIEAIDKTGMIRAAQVQYTIGDKISVAPWADSKITISTPLPEYIFLNLIFTDACFQNNTTDVSFPIDPSYVTACSARIKNETTESFDTSTISALTADILLVEDVKEGDSQLDVNECDDHQTNELKAPEISYARTKSQQVIKKESTPVFATSTEGAKKGFIAGSTNKLYLDKGISKKKQATKKQAKISYQNLIHNKSRVPDIITKTEIDPTANPASTDDNKISQVKQTSATSDITNTSLKSDKVAIVATPTKKPVEKINAANNNQDILARNTGIAKSTSLFNTKEIGISKSCTNNSNRIKSETDLFTLSIKPSRSMTLYDIHCYALSNSEITITLSQLGQLIKSFTISLNKGENQIGLSSFGLLDSNEAYLIECKTKNKGDVYLFPNCKNSDNLSTEIIIRYMDNQTAFYGLTYEIEQ